MLCVSETMKCVVNDNSLAVMLSGVHMGSSTATLRFIPLFTEDLLQFSIFCCLQGWRCGQRANCSQVLNQLNMLSRTI